MQVGIFIFERRAPRRSAIAALSQTMPVKISVHLSESQKHAFLKKIIYMP